MIIYFDLRRIPLFRSVFKKSGVRQQNHYRGFPAYYTAGKRIARRLPAGGFYTRPKFSKGDDKIIVFDSYTNPRYLRWLMKKEPDRRIILWCWNVVPGEEWLRRIPKEVEIWTYSREDSRKYGLKYNTQFFFDCLADEAEACEARLLPDAPKVLFFGREKGRREALAQLGDEIRAAGAQLELVFMPTLRGKYALLKEKLIPYEAVVERIKGADVILDYVLDPGSGLSLRCMEALFFGRKLITNNREILEADFYDPANIYVIGASEGSLEMFFRRPMVQVDPAVRDRYRLSAWLKRFDGEGEPV